MHSTSFVLFGIMALLFSTCAAVCQDDRFGDALPEGAVQRLGTLRMRYASGIGDLCYLPDGRGVFAVGSRLEICDLAQGTLLATHQVGKYSIVSIFPRRDGKALLLADSGKNVHEWDLEAQRSLRTWPTGQTSLRRACYSPDESRVLTTGGAPPTLKEWELATGKELVSITGKMHYFHEGIYGPEGKTALVDGAAGSDPIVAHYDLSNGKLLNEWLKNYYTHPRSIALSQDGARLLVGSRTMATEWQLDGYKLLKTFTGHHGHAVTSVAYCREPDQLLTGSRDGSIRRWDRLKAEVLLRWCPHDDHVTRLAVSPDGQWVLSYGGSLVAETNLATGEPRLKWDRHEGPVEAVAFLPDGRHVVSGSADGTLRVWDVNSGASVRLIQGAALGAYTVAVSPDGLQAAAGCKDGVVREFNLTDGALLRELKGHLGYVRSVAYTHDGTRLLSSADDGSICVWRNASAEPEARLCGHRGGVLSMAISANDRYVASGGRDGTVRLWDLGQARLIKTLEGHYSWVEAVAFCAQDRQVLSGGLDARLLRWDAETGQVLAEIEHPGQVFAIKLSPSGARAYSASSSRMISCWDLQTSKLIQEWKGHARAINGLSLSPDGTQLVSASDDTTLLVWKAPEE